MRTISKICIIAAILLWSVAFFALFVTWLGTHLFPAGGGNVSIFDIEGNEWLMNAWDAAVGGVAMAIALCIALKKKEGWNLLPAVLAAVAAAVALVVALTFYNALPSKVGVQYETQGITAWRLIWRHLTPVISGVLVIIAAMLNRFASRNDRIRAENEAYKEHYDLSGDPLFADTEKSTIGLDTYAEDFGVQKPVRKLKRSLRRKQK